MELKVNVKTILLFSAFFVLAGMILGFYSCSAHNTPVAPDANPGDEQLLPPLSDTDSGDTMVYMPETPAVDGQGDVGFILSAFNLAIDASGNASMRDTVANSTVAGPFPDFGGYTFTLTPGVTIAFSPFTEVGNNVEGNVTLINHSAGLILFNPRLIFVRITQTVTVPYPGPGLINDTWDFSGLIKSGLIDNDGFSTIYTGAYKWGVSPKFGYPFIFIADEDEGYSLEYGESASHSFMLEMYGTELSIYQIFFVSEIVETDDPYGVPEYEETLTGIPHHVSAVLEENPESSGSNIEVIVDMDYFDENRSCFIMVNFTYLSYALEPAGMENDKYVFTGTIPVKPSVDGPVKVLTIIPPVPSGVISDGDSIMVPMNSDTFYNLLTFG